MLTEIVEVQLKLYLIGWLIDWWIDWWIDLLMIDCLKTILIQIYMTQYWLK